MTSEHVDGDDSTVDEPNDSQWTATNRRLVYNAPPWLRVDLADVRKPSGQQEEHHSVSLPRAAMVVALDKSGERVLLAWRHRWVPDLWSWELPGGLIEDGEFAQGNSDTGTGRGDRLSA